MLVGIPKEKKKEEYRVGGLPETVAALVSKGHKVFVEKDAGIGVGVRDEDYIRAGAQVCETPRELYGKCELIVKVKEPLPEEYPFLKNGQIIFTFFHFAADRKMTGTLLEKKIHCFAYELVEDRGHFPILGAMSEIAGRLAPQQGAKYLEKEYGGKGILLSGGHKTRKGRVVVIGGGIVGVNAALISLGLGADVVILELAPPRIESLKRHFGQRCKVAISSPANIEKEVKKADVIIGAVMVAGAKAPRVLRKKDLGKIEEGSVLVDVAIDQGGCFETSRPTNHSEPVFIEEGVLHYCVSNMPGIVPMTSTAALVASTTPHILLLADKGVDAVKENKPLSAGYALGDGRILSSKIAL